MKKFALAASLTLLAATAHSQTPSVLIEACNAVADPGKRLECLKAAMGTGSATTQVQPLAAVNRAFAGMEASIDAGVSYNNYQVAMLDLAKAIATFRHDGGESMKEAAKLFGLAVETYSDAGAFWARSIEFYARRDNGIAYAGGLPVSMNGMDWLVGKYGLSTGKADIWGIERGLPVDSTRSELWRIAKQRTAKAQAAANPLKPDEVSARLTTPYPPIGDDSERVTANKMVIGAACSSVPFLAMLDDSPTRKEFAAKCDGGQALSIVCSEGMCKGKFLQ